MDQQSGSGHWQPRPDASFGPLRAPRGGAQSVQGLSVNAPEFVPKKTVPPPQQQPQFGVPHHQQHQHRYRGDNSGGGGGGGGGFGGGGGGGGAYNMVPMVQHYPQQHDNGGMANGTEMVGKSSLSDRLKNLQVNSQGPQQPQPQMGHNSYSDNKDQRLQHQQHHQPHHQQQHLPMHQNAGGHYPFAVTGMGYSSTALNNHLHHPILGGMAAAAVTGGGGGPGMMPHDNRGKNNSSVRTRLHNAQNNQMHHQQQHHQQHHQQQHHHQQMPPHHMGGGNNDYRGDADAEQVTEGETLALDYLTEVIAELYDNPGMFENIQRKLKGTFVEFRGNNFVLSNAVEMIFEQSIKEQNFRYMGARLCSLLDCLDDGQESVLRQLLSMKMDHQQSELHGFMQNEQIKVRGTTLFLAELYMQLRKPHDAMRNIEIAMRITSAAKVLLSKEGPENIKCVCQCLKLCGFELERDCRGELTDILESLGNLEGSIDCSTGRFVRSVLELQQKSWGRNEEVVPAVVPAQPSLPAESTDEFNDSPVFYGPDGQVMTQEENDFLETAAPVAFEEFDDDEDPDELVDDDNMDMEIKMAFKDFVASSKNRQPY